MIKLKQIKVKGVRGIIDGPDLEFGESGLLLCGDNGTGKSSYVDAIEKVLTGYCSTLDRRIQSISWRKQGTNIDCDKSEIDLVIINDGNEEHITLNTDPSTLRNKTREFLDATKQKSFILRRRTLLDFIDSEPNERYRALSDFLRLDEYVNFESQIKELTKKIEVEIKAQKEVKVEHENTIRNQLGLTRTHEIKENTCLEIANTILNSLNLELINTIGEIQSRLETIELLLIPFKNMDEFQKTQKLIEEFDKLPKICDLLKIETNYLETRKKAISEENKLVGKFFSEVLINGLAWIVEDKLDNCPLCDSPIDISEVSIFIKSKLESNQELIKLKQEQSSAHTIFIKTIDSYIDIVEEIETQWNLVFKSSISKELISLIRNIKHSKEINETFLSVEEIEVDISDLQKMGFDSHIEKLQKDVQRKLESFPDNAKYTKLYNAKLALAAISYHQLKINSLIGRINYLDDNKSQIIILSALAEDARKKTVQHLLNNIVKIANSYFQKIHPGEDIGNPEMIIPGRGSGSIELTTKFHTESGDPRGHYSEGHIDSLGLCLFLAIRRFHNNQRPALSLLILDDVLHSIDSNHRRNTADLIFSEFSDHQIIITTHDPLWFEYLKIASRNGKGKVYQKRIASWSLDTGPVWGDHLSNYEWLTSEKVIEAKPADKVNKAGILLEEILRNLCSNLTIAVPFNINGDYTIDPLWKSFYANAKKKQGFFSLAKEVLKEVEELRCIRNWVGAHWNEWALRLSDAEAQAFVEATINLRKLVYCEKCNLFISRIPQLEEVWSCRCESIRYDDKKTEMADNPSPKVNR
jgi:DNA repair exonuclease SbcCD ATPase subunit